MDMIGRIRRRHSRGKKSEQEISRMSGLWRNTIAKWLKAPLDGEPKYRRSEQQGKLTALHEVHTQALTADVACGRGAPGALGVPFGLNRTGYIQRRVP